MGEKRSVNKLASLQDDDISEAHNKELKELMDLLKETVTETKVKLQAIQEEREQVEKDAERCVLDRDRLIPLVKKASDKARALQDLDALKQRGHLLSCELHKLEVLCCRSQRFKADSLTGMRQREAALSEEEVSVTIQSEQLRMSLSRAQAFQLAAKEELQQLQNQISTAGPDHSECQKQELLVDEYVSSLGIPAALGQTGIRTRKREKQQ